MADRAARYIQVHLTNFPKGKYDEVNRDLVGKVTAQRPGLVPALSVSRTLEEGLDRLREDPTLQVFYLWQEDDLGRQPQTLAIAQGLKQHPQKPFLGLSEALTHVEQRFRVWDVPLHPMRHSLVDLVIARGDELIRAAA